MGLLSGTAHAIADHPVLFVFVRSVVENDFRSVRALIRRELKRHEGARTLDLGCGPGTFSDLFEGDDYVGVDRNPRFIDYARASRRGVFVVGDARGLDLPEERFDQALVHGVLHQMPDEDVRRVLSECRRVLVPGGRLLVAEPLPPLSRLNLVGHLVHRARGPAHVRPAAAYRALYTADGGRIERDEVLRCGACDYHAAVLVLSP